jgi:hypothetical protein
MRNFSTRTSAICYADWRELLRGDGEETRRREDDDRLGGNPRRKDDGREAAGEDAPGEERRSRGGSCGEGDRFASGGEDIF